MYTWMSGLVLGGVGRSLGSAGPGHCSSVRPWKPSASCTCHSRAGQRPIIPTYWSDIAAE